MHKTRGDLFLQKRDRILSEARKLDDDPAYANEIIERCKHDSAWSTIHFENCNPKGYENCWVTDFLEQNKGGKCYMCASCREFIPEKRKPFPYEIDRDLSPRERYILELNKKSTCYISDYDKYKNKLNEVMNKVSFTTG